MLEIPKGLWTEAIFAKEKPETETPKVKLDNMGTLDNMDDSDDAQEEDNYPEERERILTTMMTTLSTRTSSQKKAIAPLSMRILKTSI